MRYNPRSDLFEYFSKARGPQQTFSILDTLRYITQCSKHQIYKDYLGMASDKNSFSKIYQHRTIAIVFTIFPPSSLETFKTSAFLLGTCLVTALESFPRWNQMPSSVSGVYVHSTSSLWGRFWLDLIPHDSPRLKFLSNRVFGIILSLNISEIDHNFSIVSWMSRGCTATACRQILLYFQCLSCMY